MSNTYYRASDKPPLVVRLLLQLVIGSIILATLFFAYFAYMMMQFLGIVPY